MKIAIVDNLTTDCQYLEEKLSAYFVQRKLMCETTVYHSGESFLKEFSEGRFTAVFLDNLMDGINGMETAAQIRIQDTSVPIIFVTTEESYALEGYSVQAFDYLIKPVCDDRLQTVLNRLCAQSTLEHFIEIRENRVTRRIRLRQILYVRSSGHYLEIYTKNETCRSYMTLDALLAQLKEAGEYGPCEDGLPFQNCCRGYLVNLEEVRCIDDQDFLLNCGIRVPISRSNSRNMHTAFAAFLFSKTRNML